MAAISTITVYDGAATPVVHYLQPISVTREKGVVVGLWRETASAAPTDAQVSLSISIERARNGLYLCKRILSVPVMESISGQNTSGYTAAPKVAHVMKDVRTFYASGRSDAAGRRLTRQMATNVDNNVITSVTAATSGAIPDLIDYLVAPT